MMSADRETKRLARASVAKAVRQGVLTRASACNRCGGSHANNRALMGHHADYNRPLDVEWLCGDCHRAVHPKLNPDADWVTISTTITEEMAQALDEYRCLGGRLKDRAMVVRAALSEYLKKSEVTQ